MEVKMLLHYDAAGYYDGNCVFQAMEGVFPPERTTEVALPADVDFVTNFYKFDGEKWLTEKKPTCVADLVGVVVPHETQTAHDQEMRTLIQKFATDEGYRIRDRGKDLSWEIEKIPQEEIEAQAIDAELSAFDSRVAALKDRLATAMLQGDDATVDSLKTEYANLMGA